MSISAFSFLVCGNWIDFCVLIMYSANLMNLLIGSKRAFVFFGDYFGFSMCADCDRVISSLPIHMRFISFLYLKAATRLFQYYELRIKIGRYPHIFSVFEENTFSLSPLNYIKCRSFVDVFYLIEVVPLHF